jgi:hypothetical protein
MNTDEKLQSIQLDIDKGLKKRAIDRLHGLILNYPNELMYRRKLGQIYLDIGFEDSAGKYFLLENDRTEEMNEAVTIYLKSVNESGWKILNDIKFRGDRKKLSVFANQQLNEFELLSKKETGRIPTFREKRNGNQRINQNGKLDFGTVLVIAIFISIILLIIIGLITVIRWIF